MYPAHTTSSVFTHCIISSINNKCLMCACVINLKFLQIYFETLKCTGTWTRTALQLYRIYKRILIPFIQRSYSIYVCPWKTKYFNKELKCFEYGKKICNYLSTIFWYLCVILLVFLRTEKRTKGFDPMVSVFEWLWNEKHVC